MLKYILLSIIILLTAVWMFLVNCRINRLEKNIQQLKCDSARFIMPSFTVSGLDCTPKIINKDTGIHILNKDR